VHREEKKPNPREAAKKDTMKLLQAMDKHQEDKADKAKEVRKETKNDTLKLLEKLNGQVKPKEESHR